MNRQTTTNCGNCGVELMPWDEIYKWENEWICDDCLQSKFDVLPIGEIAALLDVKHMAVEDLLSNE